MGDGHHTSCWVPKVLPSDAARPSGKHWPQAKHFRSVWLRNSKERAGSQSTIPALRQRGSHMAFLTSESMWGLECPTNHREKPHWLWFMMRKDTGAATGAKKLIVTEATKCQM